MTDVDLLYGPFTEKSLFGITVDNDTLDALIAEFYDTLFAIPEAKSVLDNLGAEELFHLKEAQKHYMHRILAPDLTAEGHREMAENIGRIHCYVGVTPEILERSHGVYSGIIRHLPEEVSTEAKRILNSRVERDLSWQMGAYTSAYQRRINGIAQIAQEQSDGRLESLQNALSNLLDGLHGEIVGLAMGSIGESGYCHQFSVGSMPWTAPAGQPETFPVVQLSVLEQVWEQETPLILHHLHGSEHSTLIDACRSLGIRSLGIFPARDHRMIPQRLFLVGSSYPGYFQGQNTLDYWQRIADLSESTMERLPVSDRYETQSRKVRQFRNALRQKKLRMFYQPITSLNGQILKVEALARLDIDGQPIAPDRFLPAFGNKQLKDLFDEGLLCVAHDRSVLGEKCPPVSINLPTEGLMDPEWMRDLPFRVEDAGFSPGSIGFEVLETTIVDSHTALKYLAHLHGFGYSILLDDVGSGEPSLLRVAELPITGIKIDQSFVRPLAKNMRNVDLLITLIRLAEERGLDCIVEGVETDGIIDIVGSIGKAMIQGYAIARPLPVEQLADFLSQAQTKCSQPYPYSLYGWYARHIARTHAIRAALCSIPDLMDISIISNAYHCPLHAPIIQLGGDVEIRAAHLDWHAHYAHYAEMLRQGVSSHQLDLEMEAQKEQLRINIQKKLGIDDY